MDNTEISQELEKLNKVGLFYNINITEQDLSTQSLIDNILTVYPEVVEDLEKSQSLLTNLLSIANLDEINEHRYLGIYKINFVITKDSDGNLVLITNNIS